MSWVHLVFLCDVAGVDGVGADLRAAGLGDEGAGEELGVLVISILQVDNQVGRGVVLFPGVGFLQQKQCLSKAASVLALVPADCSAGTGEWPSMTYFTPELKKYLSE